jgi:hypothetical protein
VFPSPQAKNRVPKKKKSGLEGLADTLNVAAPENMDNARRDAELVAKALHLPLADRTGPIEILREAGRLDESLRERRRRTGKGPGEVPLPLEGMKTQFRIEGKEVVLDIPAAGFTPAALWLLSPAVVMPAFFTFIVLHPRLRRVCEGPDDVLLAWAIGFFVFLVGFFIPIYIGVHLFLRAVVEHYTVRVSPDRLHVTTHGLFFSRVSEIPAAELEELHITAPENSEEPMEEAEIVARSDRMTVTFGRHLSPEEMEWVKVVVKHIVTA